jgi:hypothetical protein
MKRKTRKILATNEGEFSTEMVYRSGEKWYYVEQNGGSRGSWDRRCGDGVWRDRPVVPAYEIDEDEALSLASQWGYDEIDIDM